MGGKAGRIEVSSLSTVPIFCGHTFCVKLPLLKNVLMESKRRIGIRHHNTDQNGIYHQMGLQWVFIMGLL